jgi:hypothetical protein
MPMLPHQTKVPRLPLRTAKTKTGQTPKKTPHLTIPPPPPHPNDRKQINKLITLRIHPPRQKLHF